MPLNNDDEFANFIQQLDLYYEEIDQPMVDLIISKSDNRDWCEKVIKYLMINCGRVTEMKTPLTISILGSVCENHNPDNPQAMVQFIRDKLTELAASVDEERTLSSDEKRNGTFSGHTLIWLLKGIRTREAIELMEELYKDNETNAFSWPISFSLSYMKQRCK